jgi:hypothetical protein
MSESWSSIILQRTKHWIGVDLVSRTGQMTAAIIATDIVALRGDSAHSGDVYGCACVEDCVSDLQCASDKNAAAVVVANRAVRDAASSIDSATRNPSVVAADRAVR